MWHTTSPMRYSIPLFVSLCLGTLSHSFAADTAPATPAVPATPAQSAVAPNAAAATTAAAASPAADAAAAAAAAQAKRLRSAGYKPKTKNGQTVWCKQVTEIGSRLAQADQCGTPDQIEQAMQDSKDAVERMQHSAPPPRN